MDVDCVFARAGVISCWFECESGPAHDERGVIETLLFLGEYECGLGLHALARSFWKREGACNGSEFGVTNAGRAPGLDIFWRGLVGYIRGCETFRELARVLDICHWEYWHL